MARVPDHVRTTHSPDGAIVLDVKHGRMFTLNPVGSRVLDLLDQQCTTAQIAADLSREFEIDLDTAERDVNEFLAALEKYRLIDRPPVRASF